MSVQTRRSQQERSAETRARLLAAAVTLLHDRGMARTSTNDIAAAAGVSRGALTHHFSSREDLVVSAIAHMLEGVTQQLKAFARKLSAGEGSSDEIIDFLWQVMSNRLFYVTLEFLPEARHNHDFRSALVPVVSNWHGALDAIWSELASRYTANPNRARLLMNSTMCVIRGMIAQTILRDDPGYFQEMLEFWKSGVRAQLAAAAPHIKKAG